MCVYVSFATNFILPSQQSAIDELVLETSASLAKFAIIATQPVYDFDGEKEWHPADRLVSLELASLQFDRSAMLDARLPLLQDRFAGFGRFKEKHGSIFYYPTRLGLLGNELTLETVVWSFEQKALIEMVGCLLFCLFIILFF